jgi:hypothetical protein
MILNNQRTNKCKDYFSKLILKDLENFKVWVAGGAIRTWYANEKISDIDLFFPDESERQKCLNFITGMGGEIIFSNTNVDKVKYNNKVFDFCKHYRETPDKTIEDFDFTVTMAAVTLLDSYFGDDFFMDLASKRLAINSLPFPINTLMRLQKYHRRGYWICKEEMTKIINEVSNLNISSLLGQPDGTSIDLTGLGSDSTPFAGMD